jgi:hypothetical protein
MFVGTQILDGLGNEFCNIDALPFDVAKGALPEPPEGGSNIDTRATIQVGWSNEGLHVFIHVTEATIRAPPTVVYNGDAVEVFAAATGEPTGIYGAHADPGLQVAVAPPLPSGTTGICAASSLTARGFTCQEWWASLRVDGGYNVEMQLPWDAFGAAVPSAGDRIALDFRCDIQGADGGLAFASSLWASPLSFDASACPKFGYPSLMTSCDDRTWCIYPLGAK